MSPITRPVVGILDTERIVGKFYPQLASTTHAKIQITELDSERDRNFFVEIVRNDEACDTKQYVLKVCNSALQPHVLQLQLQLMFHAALAAQRPENQWVRFCIPSLILPGSMAKEYSEDKRGSEHGNDFAKYTTTETLMDGSVSLVYMLEYVAGTLMSKLRYFEPDFYYRLGAMLGSIDKEFGAVKTDVNPDSISRFPWNISYADQVVQQRVHCLDSTEKQDLVSELIKRVDFSALRNADLFPRSWIHNDANDNNLVIVSPHELCVYKDQLALIDFGDFSFAPRIVEVAVACAYAILDRKEPGGSHSQSSSASHANNTHPLRTMASILRGYHLQLPLQENEIEVLFDLVMTRLAVSLCNSAHQSTIEPQNKDYLLIDASRAWDMLKYLYLWNSYIVKCYLRSSVGLNASPLYDCFVRFCQDRRSKSDAGFFPVINLDPQARYHVLDLESGFAQDNNASPWTAPDSITIGRYNEVRNIYTDIRFSSSLLDLYPGKLRRNIHLGFDLGVAPGTSVFAVMEGEVAFAVDNIGTGNYGPTIIIKHSVPATQHTTGFAFYTLYGHLSRVSLDTIKPGMFVASGKAIGSVGTLEENGNWPPHLHFQLILDFDKLPFQNGDFPGTCTAVERSVFTSICPDPMNVLSGMMPPTILCSVVRVPDSVLLQKRMNYIGPNLSLSYRAPLHMLTASGCYMVDADGVSYLDCVNNPIHVGHNNARVNQAAIRAMTKLNTNTRYLYEGLTEYAEKLVQKMPDPSKLKVCFFVNSGSEANDLALRLARCHTKKRGIVCIGSGYHGHTQSLIDVSHYKFAGKGGMGPPDYVRVAACPNPFRGKYTGDDVTIAKQYADEVASCAKELANGEYGLAAFIVEAISGCGGQVVPPQGFLASAMRSVKELGGVCIADEVQTGFGRVGSHFWAFEAVQAADLEVPDVVTLGKPIGNGHPVGAVITTVEIARSFSETGMEFFSTFGGSPVSCAIAEAVLDEIEEKKLQRHAYEVGAYLKAGLTRLRDSHICIGDVRGMGLFLGVEFVYPSMHPNRKILSGGDLAKYVINRIRDYDHQILLSLDGPDTNVLKIKPPMVFSQDDADRLVFSLDKVLLEDPIQQRMAWWSSQV